MNIYIWEMIEQCSKRYHSEGGLVVIAESEQRARELAATVGGCKLKESEKPDLVRPTEGKEFVMVFPDAGCC